MPTSRSERPLLTESNIDPAAAVWLRETCSQILPEAYQKAGFPDNREGGQSAVREPCFEVDMPATVLTNDDSNNFGHRWSYTEAFSRNRGLISPAEQETLRSSCVAIPGMGGVGGIHLITLTRLGIGSFRIADPDTFQLANMNRQYGAEVATVHRNKAEVMAEKARAINPDVKITAFSQAIGPDNVEEFLAGADVVVDAIDYFALNVRRLVFDAARKSDRWAVTAGPIGFGTAWLTFDPKGMSFDDYFDVRDGMDPLDEFVAFTMGICPAGLHWPYFDVSQIDGASARGPSLGLACQLATGVTSTEVSKILLRRGSMSPAPHYSQFDAYRNILRRGKLRWGNRHPMQRLKRHIFRKRMLKLGFGHKGNSDNAH